MSEPTHSLDTRPPAGISRRSLLQAAGGGIALAGGALALGRARADSKDDDHGHAHGTSHSHGHGTVGTVDSDYPARFAQNFHRGKPVPDDALGEAEKRRWPKPDAFFEIHAIDRPIEIAPGIEFPAWTYGMRRDGTRPLPLQGNVPGPTLRVLEGDEVLIRFVNQGVSHPHTIHFHGVHEAAFDGAFPDQFVYPGQEFWYRFKADPYGLHLYHCHSLPLKRHVHKGLYGVFIIDPGDGSPTARGEPRPARPQRTAAGKDPTGNDQEYVFVLNGFDTNFDGENEVYAVNSVAFYYTGDRAIPVKKNSLVRAYIVNFTEFDPINSFHLHANFYYAIRTGTRILQWGDEAAMEEAKSRFEFTDILMLCQAERAILEFKFPHEGDFMFHAHQSEFVELGWMSLFRVVP